jgi:hypothetical protein
VNDAFSGNKEAQKIAMEKSQYVVLTDDQKSQWDEKTLKRVFGTGDIAIYTKK